MAFWIILTYLVLLVLVSAFSYRKGFVNVFSTGKKLSWVLAGVSLFAINPDNINVLSKMGILAEEGYAGLWIFYTGVFGAGLLPIVFAPLWSRLRFMTDNQFILLRFSGRPARILHLFRAGYVGYLVVSLFIAQVFIGLSKLLVVFFEVSYIQSYLILGGLLLLIIAKNSLQLKVRTDFLNGLVYLLAFALGAFFVVKHAGGFREIYGSLNHDYPDYIRLIPSGFKGTSFGSLPVFLTYFFIQWWSVNVLDGAGPEAQRFMNIRNSFDAFRAAFLPLVLFAFAFLLHSFVLDAGIILLNESPGMVPVIHGNADTEAFFISIYRNAMPAGMFALVFLAFLVAFIGFIEAFINWGSGFVVVDLFRTYMFRDRKDRFYTILSYLVMFLIGYTGLLIAFFNTHLLGLQKFIFAMGAGVGPVFILRWFWWRINAWSQLTAMVASLVLAVGWDLGYDHSEAFRQMVDACLVHADLSYYAFKLICLTVLVSIAWLAVTFLTNPDDPSTLENFVKEVNPGGIWPGKKGAGSKISGRKVLLVALYALVSILPFLMIWTFKFRSIFMGLAMLMVWFGLLAFIIRSMARHEH
jgi:solute:Na+ symporter, SSS family